MEPKVDKGMSVFLDVFRRADKNDDDALHWEEFKAFFADGVLSEEELRSLFHEIDTHNTNNIDTGELCEYFAKHLGPFKDMFCAIEDLNGAVSKSLLKSSEEYPKSNLVEQFTARFLLREMTSQLAASQRTLDTASDVLEERALRDSEASVEKGTRSATANRESPKGEERRVIGAETIEQVDPASIMPGRYGRRAKRPYSTQTSWPMDYAAGGGVICQQVERLRSLLDRMENRVNFKGMPEEETVKVSDEQLLAVVSRKLLVNSDCERAFRNSLRNYIEALGKDEDCLHVSIRSYSGSPMFAIYEIWTSEEHWKRFLATTEGKTFRHNNIDHLEMPEQLNSIKLPRSWLKDE